MDSNYRVKIMTHGQQGDLVGIMAVLILLCCGIAFGDEVGEVSENRLAQIRELLSPDKHMSPPYGLLSQDGGEGLYDRQLRAIDDIGDHKIAALASFLCYYLDYPRDRLFFITSTYKATNHMAGNRTATLKQWPAYRSLIAIGDKAVPAVRAFASDDDSPIPFRVTAIQVLGDLNDKEGQRVALDNLVDDLADNEDGYYLRLLELIDNNELPFYGVRRPVHSARQER